MKKFYTILGTALMLVLMLLSLPADAQPDVDKTVIFVGQYQSTTILEPRPEDQVAIDSISQWVNVVFMDGGVFNEASADELYGEGETNAKGVIISESIGGGAVANFGLRDNYPVPCIIMEAAQFSGDPASTDRWVLLNEDGGTWGYDPASDGDVQWKIADDMHYITDEYSIGDVINYAPAPDRGVPYLHGFFVDHYILATGGRTDGGAANPSYVQDQAAALAILLDPEILFMNVAYTYLAVGSVDFYNILHRSVKYMFDAHPVGIDQVLTEEFNLSVYPNPARDHTVINFSADAAKDVSLNLYSISGALTGNLHTGITAGGENEVRLNMMDYSPGLYFVELQIENKISYAKLVLQ